MVAVLPAISKVTARIEAGEVVEVVVKMRLLYIMYIVKDFL
jgi:hypothetical protein